MNILFTLILILASGQLQAQALRPDSRILEKEILVGEYGFIGTQKVIVWPPGTYISYDSKIEPAFMKEAKDQPLLNFKEEVEAHYKKFQILSQKFNSCIEKKSKWPSIKDCISEVKYCFGTKRNVGCDTWKHSLMSELCPGLKLLKCIEKKEEAFKIIVRCFNPDQNIGFKFFFKDHLLKPEEKILMVRVTSSFNPQYDVSCSFTFYNNEFHLVGVSDGSWIYKPVEIVIPEAHPWFKLHENYKQL